MLSLPSEVEILITTRLLCLMLPHRTWYDNRENKVFQFMPSSPKNMFSDGIFSHIPLLLSRFTLCITKPFSELFYFYLVLKPLRKYLTFYRKPHTYSLGRARCLPYTKLLPWQSQCCVLFLLKLLLFKYYTFSFFWVTINLHVTLLSHNSD